MNDHSSVLEEAISELSRRRVFRVAGAYAIAGWLVVEMSSVVFPALFFPDWALRLVIYGALAGFPLAIVLAWIFDITPSGVVVTSNLDASDTSVKSVKKTARILEGVIIAGIVVALGTAGYFHYSTRATLGDPPPSIAVLPFANLSDNQENEYFSDGIAEEILNALVKLEGLQVAARTSSFAFKGTNRNVREIGQELNVNHVLEGSVRRAGERLRVTVQLIKVEDGFHVWSENYERTMDDVFAIQDEISRAIVEALKVQLFSQPNESLVAATTESGEAYNLYLLGRYQWHKRTQQSLTRAIELFEQAIERDSGYALAYSGLADAYLLLNSYGSLSFKAAKLKAEPAIAIALKLDKTIAEPYASLGLLHMVEQDFDGAEPLLRAAIDLNPNYAVAHHWLGLTLLQNDGPISATVEFTRALELDPLNPTTIQNITDTLSSLGRHDESIQYWEKLFRTHDGRLAPYYALAILSAQESGALQYMAQFATDVLKREPRDPLAISAHAFVNVYLNRDVELSLNTIYEAWQRSEGDPNVLNFLNFAYVIANRSEQIIQNHIDYYENMDRKDLQSDPAFMLSLVWAGAAASRTGQHELAREFLEPLFENEQARNILFDPQDRWFFLSTLAWSYSKLGMPGRAKEIVTEGLGEMNDALARGWNTPRVHAMRGLLLAMQGERVKAMAALKDAYDRGWVDWWWINTDERFDSLRAYSTFREIAEGMNERLESVTLK